MGANMDMHDHSPTPGGRAFLYGGIAVGLLVMVLLLTHGFGLFAPRPTAEAPPALMRKGEQLFVPETSPLRQRLAVEAAAARETTTIIRAPGNVETPPTHLLTVLPPGAGRVPPLSRRGGSAPSARGVPAPRSTSSRSAWLPAA